MASRTDIVTAICTEGVAELRRHTTDDFVADPEGGVTLSVLKATVFPDMVIEVHEAVEIPGDRVLALLSVRGNNWPDAPRWRSVACFKFRGEQISEAWAVSDQSTWLQAIGLLDMAEVNRKIDRGT